MEGPGGGCRVDTEQGQREAGSQLLSRGRGDALSGKVGAAQRRHSPVGGRAGERVRLMKRCRQREQRFSSMAALKGRRWSCPASVVTEELI